METPADHAERGDHLGVGGAGRHRERGAAARRRRRVGAFRVRARARAGDHDQRHHDDVREPLAHPRHHRAPTTVPAPARTAGRGPSPSRRQACGSNGSLISIGSASVGSGTVGSAVVVVVDGATVAGGVVRGGRRRRRRAAATRARAEHDRGEQHRHRDRGTSLHRTQVREPAAPGVTGARVGHTPAPGDPPAGPGAHHDPTQLCHRRHPRVPAPAHRQALRVPRPARLAHHEREADRAHRRAGDPARVDRGVDLPGSPRSPPGHGTRRARPEAVPVPPRVAAAAGGGQVRPAARLRRGAARHPQAGRRRTTDSRASPTRRSSPPSCTCSRAR